MSQNTDQKSLTFLEKAGTALAAAQDFALKVNNEKQAALKLAEPLADALVEAQLVEATERPILLSKIASHDGALEVIGNLVKHIGKMKTAYAQKLAVAQGGGSPTSDLQKTAGAESGNGHHQTNGSPVVGQRAGLGEKRASDEPLRRLAGLTN